MISDNDSQGTDASGDTDQDKTKPDPLKNLHSEFSRKTEKLAQENQKLSSQLSEVLQILNKNTLKQAPSSQSADEDLEELAFKDPKAYAKRVKAEAAQEASTLVSRQIQAQQHSQSVLNQLVSEYPELNEASNELTLKAVENYKNMSDEDKRSAGAYKIAVRDAAAELGVLPKNKRKSTSNDDFALSGNASTSNPKGNKRGEVELDQRTIAFAKLIGLNTDDKKVMESLKNRSQRKSWSKYE